MATHCSIGDVSPTVRGEGVSAWAVQYEYCTSRTGHMYCTVTVLLAMVSSSFSRNRNDDSSAPRFIGSACIGVVLEEVRRRRSCDVHISPHTGRLCPTGCADVNPVACWHLSCNTWKPDITGSWHAKCGRVLLAVSSRALNWLQKHHGWYCTAYCTAR